MIWAASVERDGFAVVPAVLSQEWIGRLRCEFEGEEGAGVRNILFRPTIRELAAAPEIQGLVQPVLGKAWPVRGLYFDKPPKANWKVPWHQDATIAVRKRAEVEGFSAWSIKDGVHHVRPPAWVLEGMLAIRLHLDDCGEDNGPLQVLPGTHRFGKLTADQKAPLIEGDGVSCLAPKGAAVLMRPLLLHSSSQALRPTHRRVVHLEYASVELPAPLQWLS